MGGIGSGRRARRHVVEDYVRIDVRILQRKGLLAPGSSSCWRWSSDGDSSVDVIAIRVYDDSTSLTFSYALVTDSGRRTIHHLPINLVWTDCYYGGQRPWFECPVSGCGRRVAILYGSDAFACRHCLALAYSCQREKVSQRACRRAMKMRERLGWRSLPFFSHDEKPPGMHWKSYERLTGLHDKFVAKFRSNP
jgi:hypothetical protein